MKIQELERAAIKAEADHVMLQELCAKAALRRSDLQQQIEVGLRAHSPQPPLTFCGSSSSESNLRVLLGNTTTVLQAP